MNYHDETEAGINKQINIELFAHYCYLALVRETTCLRDQVIER